MGAITGATSLVPLGGPPVAGFNRRLHFTCSIAMETHTKHLSSYCESTWALRTHTRTNTHMPYVYRHRGFQPELEQASLQCALVGSFNTGLIPSSSLCANEEGGHRQFCGRLLPYHGGGGGPKSLKPPTQSPASGCRSRHQQPHALQRPLLLRSSHSRSAHRLPACAACQGLFLLAAYCCSEGHHAPGYVGCRPLSKVY